MADVNNVDVLGVLDVPPFGQRAVYVNKLDELQFYIRPISNVPEAFSRIRQFTGFGPRLSDYFEDERTGSDDERSQRLEEFLRDKVLIFKIETQRKSRDEVYHVASHIRIRPKSERFRPNQTFIPTPVYSQMQHHHTYEAFRRLLLERRPIGRIDNISSHRNDTPEFILWRHEDGTLSAFGPFRQHEYIYGFGGFRLEWDGVPRVFEHLQPDWLADCYDADQTVLFIPLEAHRDLGRLLASDEAEELRDIGAKTDSIVIAQTELEKGASREPDLASLELQFLKHFENVTRAMGLRLSFQDLCNFHVSMKTSSLTILAGLTGTGKSRLVQAYAKALGSRHKPKLIPVEPSWSDSGDLLGYVDVQHMVYRPADSGLVDVLVEAARREDPSRLYIVCLDEMNLARVEHYFSQFLSVLERDPGERRLRLYNPELQSRLYNGNLYPAEIELGDNVLFVGTVNLDESTYHFSDKVLDRANVIELDVLPFQDLAAEESASVPDMDWTAEIYNHEFRRLEQRMEMRPRELEFLWSMHVAMQESSRRLGIGVRTVRQIDLFLKNIPDGAALDRADAIDRLLCQRVFTKLRGPVDILAPLLKHGETPEDRGSLPRILEQYADIGDFPRSRRVLGTKWMELQTNGYTV